MPLFSRSPSFRTPKKPPRRNKSLPNISQLDGTLDFTTDSINLDATSHTVLGERTAQPSTLVMRLGDYCMAFEEGQWVMVGSKGAGSKEYSRLQKQSLKLLEENNLLKYKVELMLDMLAASNADCIVMQRELDVLKRASHSKNISIKT